jgi:hypothetical protein
VMGFRGSFLESIRRMKGPPRRASSGFIGRHSLKTVLLQTEENLGGGGIQERPKGRRHQQRIVNIIGFFK